MYLIKALVAATAPVMPGTNPVTWTVGQTRLVHDDLYLPFRNNPAAWEVLAGPSLESVVAAALALDDVKEAMSGNLRLWEETPVNAVAATVEILATEIAAMNNGDTIVFQEATFTKAAATDAAAGEFLNAAGLAECVNELLDGSWTANEDTDVTIASDTKGAFNGLIASGTIMEATTAGGDAETAATATIDAGTIAVIANGDTVEFDGNTFTKVAEDAEAGEFTDAAGLIVLLDDLDDWGAADSAGDIEITAAAVGAEGNDIDVVVTLSRATAGGVDGTVAAKGQPAFDESYFYLATDDNTAADTNWRRVSLGEAY